MRDDGGDEDVAAGRHLPLAEAPDPRDRQDLAFMGALEPPDDGGVDERALARARRRIEEDDRVRDDHRDEILDLAVAPEEEARVRALERPRPDVRVLRRHGSALRARPTSRAASGRTPSR